MVSFIGARVGEAKFWITLYIVFRRITKECPRDLTVLMLTVAASPHLFSLSTNMSTNSTLSVSATTWSLMNEWQTHFIRTRYLLILHFCLCKLWTEILNHYRGQHHWCCYIWWSLQPNQQQEWHREELANRWWRISSVSPRNQWMDGLVVLVTSDSRGREKRKIGKKGVNH